MRKIKDATFTVVANGFADGPAQALRDFLNQHQAKDLIEINHPLVAENEGRHLVTIYKNGKKEKTRSYKLLNKPPYTFLFDPFIPLHLPRTNAWFGFNNLACIRGLLRKKIGINNRVFYWAVDFVPERFGKNLMTRTYNNLDRYVSKKADVRIELSQAALEGRTKYLGLKKDASLALVVPMGAWLQRTPKAKSSNWAKKKIVYLGHLVERQGVDRLIRAAGILKEKGVSFNLEIIGSGPMKEELEDLSVKLGIKNKVVFHGFVKDHKEVESILADSTVAAAPYILDQESFTQYADPGKLKAYLGAALPIVLTRVPPNASEIEEMGAGKIVNDEPKSIAEGIEYFISNKSRWINAHESSSGYARQFDWDVLLTKCLKNLGFET